MQSLFVSNNVIIGNADDELTTSASNAVLIGHNADVKVDGGVALGSGSYTAGSNVANPTISSLQFDFGDGLKVQEVEAEGNKRVLVSLDKNSLKGDPDFKGDPGKDGKDGINGKDGGVGTV